MFSNSLYYEGKRSEVVDFLPEKYHRVLEIGCGKGGFRENLTNKCEYWGIEPCIDVANVANNKLDKVLVGTFEDMSGSLPENYFDLVICNDVIEHMNDHNKFFNDIQVHCVKNTCIVGSIPNVRYIMNLYGVLIKKDWEYVDTGILDKTHLRFFTKKSLKRDFINHDFYIEKLDGINKASFSKRTLGGIVMTIFQYFLGEDTKYLQFGFRVRLRKS